MRHKSVISTFAISILLLSLTLWGCQPRTGPSPTVSKPVEATAPAKEASSRFFAGPVLSPDGVELTDFSVEGPEPVKVGDTLVVRFTYRNTTGVTMHFSSYGVLVACRDPDDKNRDFGHREVRLAPGESFTMEAQIKVDKPGLWRFWPGYWLEHWGPFKRYAITVEVREK